MKKNSKPERFTELIYEEIKRNDFITAGVFFLVALFTYFSLSKIGVFSIVSDSINHMINFHIRMPDDSLAPEIYVFQDVGEPTIGEIDATIQWLYEASHDSDKRIFVITKLDWIFQELGSDTPNVIPLFTEMNRDTSNMRVFFVYPSYGEYEAFLKGYNALPVEIRNNIYFLDYIPPQKAHETEPYSFFVPIPDIPGEVSLIEKLGNMLGISIWTDTVKVISRLEPKPYKVIRIIDMEREIYEFSRDSAFKLLKNSRSKNLIFIYLPWTFDEHVVLIPNQSLRFSDVCALSIWEAFYPIEAQPLPPAIDVLIFAVVALSIVLLRKKINNLLLATGIGLLTVVGVAWYIYRPFHLNVFDRHIFELGVSLWTGYFSVFTVETLLFSKVIALIKEFVVRSPSYGNLSEGLAQPFYEALKRLIPEISAIVVEDRFLFFSRKQVIGSLNLTEHTTRKNYVPYMVKRRVGIFETAVLRVYFHIENRPTREELSFIEHVWHDPVFVPFIFDKLYTEKKLRGNVYNIYNADAYTKALVHESNGFRRLVDSMDSGAAIFCSTGVLVYCNKRFYGILGIEKVAPQSTAFEIFSGTFLESLIPLIRESMLYNTPLIREVYNPQNGLHYKVIFKRLSTEKSPNVHLYMMTIQDVTYRFNRFVEEMSIRKSTIYLIVHELRNALSFAMADIELIKKTSKGKLHGKAALRLNALELAIKMVVEHINKLKFFAELQQGSVQVKLTSVDLKDLILEVVRFIESVYKGRKLWANSEIIVDVPDNISLVADKVLLKIVLKNLIENALKYSRSRAMIVAREEGENVIIDIEDDGEGIPPDKVDIIWKPFTRPHIKKETGEKIPGLGLGLFIVHNLFDIKAIDGKILVGRSEKLGGAKFTLVIRKKPNHPNTTSR